MDKTFYIDENKSLYVIVCANCGHINKYNKIIKDELCFCEKCKTKINPLTWNKTVKWAKGEAPKLSTIEDYMICGLCKHYDSDMCFCLLHPEYGEMVEQDTCDDYCDENE